MSNVTVVGKTLLDNWTESDAILGPANIRIIGVEYAKRYLHADMHGVGEVRLSYCALPYAKTEFSGYELFTGIVNGARGSFVIHINGEIDGTTHATHAQIEIKQGSGCDELHTIRGTGSFVVSSKGSCSYKFHLRL